MAIRKRRRPQDQKTTGGAAADPRRGTSDDAEHPTAEGEATVEAAAVAEPETEPETEPITPPAAASEPATEPDPATDTVAGGAAEPGSEPDAERDEEPEQQPTPEAKPKPNPDAKPDAEPEPEPHADPDDQPSGPVSPRTGWVVAAFFLFWPLAIPALRASVRASEANGAAKFEEARRQSLRTLDLSLSAVCVGGFGLLAVILAVALAPTYVTPAMAASAEAYIPAGLLQAVTGYPPSTAAEADPWPAGGGASDEAGTGDGLDGAGQGGDLADPAATTGTGDDSYGNGGAADGTGSIDPADLDGTAIQDLEVGDCFATNGLDDAAVLYTVEVIPCADLHGAEIFAATTVPSDFGAAGERPDQQTLARAAHEYCLPQFEEFVGVPYGESSLTYWPIVPSQESWEDDDRRLTCVLESAQDVRGSQEGVGR